MTLTSEELASAFPFDVTATAKGVAWWPGKDATPEPVEEADLEQPAPEAEE